MHLEVFEYEPELFESPISLETKDIVWKYCRVDAFVFILAKVGSCPVILKGNKKEFRLEQTCLENECVVHAQQGL